MYWNLLEKKTLRNSLSWDGLCKFLRPRQSCYAIWVCMIAGCSMKNNEEKHASLDSHLTHYLVNELCIKIHVHGQSSNGIKRGRS